jgi:hypothetical protein
MNMVIFEHGFAHTGRMEFEDTETMCIEEAREMTIAAVREEYANEWFKRQEP